MEDKNILSRESSPAGNDQSLVDLSEGAGKVQSVGLTFRPNSTASRVTVSESTSPTGNSSTPSNTVATYLDIEADTDVSKDIELKVTVSKSALGDIAVEDAVLLHYTDGSWKELADSESSRNNNEVTITATTSGLSPFAVAASNAATDNTESSDTGSENEGDNGTTSGGDSIADTDEDAGGSVADDDSSTSTGEGDSDDNSTSNETDNSSTPHGDTADDDTTTGDNTNNSTASDANNTTTNDSTTISDGTNDDTTSDSTPGFGTLAALTVLVAGTLLAARGID
ncbi:PGF-pre-PGF domain-containing protein [Halorubrum sp. PV6]|uniref:PGF-pre-PGF domain-containing protein n=1 Tax=Halorubrum sp. PV6 TaxID=634157 RepID=UPI00210F7567